MDWSGLIPIFGGIYGYFLSIGYFPKNPKDPEKMELWRKKYGGIMKKLSPFLVLFGIIQLTGVLQSAGQVQPSRSEVASRVAQQLEDIEPGKERELGDGVFMLMHKLQAVQPLGDGWHLAKSTEGSFSVEMPLPFNDFRMRAQTTDKVEMRAHSVGAKTPGLLAWTATCIARRDGKLGPDGHAPSVDKTEIMGTPPVAHKRFVEFADMTCFLIVEAQGSDSLPDEVDRLRFLQSLKRSGNPVW
jgi:hypothetical protein